MLYFYACAVHLFAVECYICQLILHRYTYLIICNYSVIISDTFLFTNSAIVTDVAHLSTELGRRMIIRSLCG